MMPFSRERFGGMGFDFGDYTGTLVAERTPTCPRQCGPMTYMPGRYICTDCGFNINSIVKKVTVKTKGMVTDLARILKEFPHPGYYTSDNSTPWAKPHDPDDTFYLHTQPGTNTYQLAGESIHNNSSLKTASRHEVS